MERRLHHLQHALVASLLIVLRLISAGTRWAYSSDADESDQRPPAAFMGIEVRLRDLERKYSLLADENRRLTLQLEGLAETSGEPSPEIRVSPPDPAIEAPP
jgi:hypothetical protein